MDRERQTPISDLYGPLMAHYLHEDRMVWSGVQFLIAIQTGVLVAGFSQRLSWYAPAIMVFGFLITAVILGFISKSSKDRDLNLHVMDALVENLLPREVISKFDDIRGESRNSPRYVSLTSEPPRWLPFLRGRYLLYGIFATFMFLDIALAVTYQWFDGLL